MKTAAEMVRDLKLCCEMNEDGLRMTQWLDCRRHGTYASSLASDPPTCLSNAYVNARTGSCWRCARGHVWLAPLDSVRSGRCCQRCSGKGKKAVSETRAAERRPGLSSACLASAEFDPQNDKSSKVQE